jgi:c-di-GMP-binding flagellar brake protein YcgR
MNNQPKVNMKCEVIYEGKTYKSIVQDVTEEYVGIAIPIRKGSYLNPQRNEPLEVIYYDGEKNVLKFISKVIGRKNDGITMLLLSLPTTINKVQRREFFRIELVENVKYKIIEKNISDEQFEEIINNSDSFDSAVLLDLSGGGLKIRTKSEIKEGDTVIIQMPLINEKISVMCECVRSLKDLESKFYTCGLTFTQLENGIREKLISYVFQLMRKLKQK